MAQFSLIVFWALTVDFKGASHLPPPEPIIEQRLLQACQFRENVGLNLSIDKPVRL